MPPSVHFSYKDLYSAIVNDDIPGTEMAILFLGVHIHEVQIWCGRTAMEFAARLGHLEQAKLIFHELERYDADYDIQYEISVHIEPLFCELIPHRGEDPDFLRELITKYPKECGPCIDKLVLAGAFDLLECLVKEDEDCISLMVESCFRHGETRVFDVSEWMEHNPVFMTELHQYREKDPLAFAILQRDWTETARLIMRVVEDSGVTYTCVETSDYHKALPTSAPKYRHSKEEQLRSPSFVSLIVKTGDVNMVKNLLSADILPQILQLTNLSKQNKQKLAEFMMRAALYNETVSVLDVILSQIEQSDIVWWHLYYDLIVDGKFKSASAIKHLCPRYLDQNAKMKLYQAFGNDKPALSFMFRDTPASVVCEVVDAIESFPRNPPSDRSQWRKCLNEFPVKMGRPDVAKHFRSYGFHNSEADVIQLVAENSLALKVDCYSEWDTVTFIRPALSTRITCGVEFAKAFLGESAQAIAVEVSGVEKTIFKPVFAPCSELLSDCATETGKAVMKVIDSFMNLHIVGSSTIISRAIESERRKSLTLKKLCRLTIRRCIRVANPGKSLTDTILSVYVEGHLPRPMILYLLYRDGDQHQPLYYRLLKPAQQPAATPSQSDVDSYYDSSDDDVPFGGSYFGYYDSSNDYYEYSD